MKFFLLLVALQATHLTHSLPLLQAQAPNDILAIGVQSLPLSLEAPATTGVCPLPLAYRWLYLLIASKDHSRGA